MGGPSLDVPAFATQFCQSRQTRLLPMTSSLPTILPQTIKIIFKNSSLQWPMWTLTQSRQPARFTFAVAYLEVSEQVQYPPRIGYVGGAIGHSLRDLWWTERRRWRYGQSASRASGGSRAGATPTGQCTDRPVGINVHAPASPHCQTPRQCRPIPERCHQRVLHAASSSDASLSIPRIAPTRPRAARSKRRSGYRRRGNPLFAHAALRPRQSGSA